MTGHQVLIVYTQMDDGSEPISCAVLSEVEALRLESINILDKQIIRTSWEDHYVTDRDNTWPPERPMYLVVEGVQAPVTIGVYANGEDAVEQVIAHESTSIEVVPMRISQVGD